MKNNFSQLLTLLAFLCDGSVRIYTTLMYFAGVSWPFRPTATLVSVTTTAIPVAETWCRRHGARAKRLSSWSPRVSLHVYAHDYRYTFDLSRCRYTSCYSFAVACLQWRCRHCFVFDKPWHSAFRIREMIEVSRRSKRWKTYNGQWFARCQWRRYECGREKYGDRSPNIFFLFW